MKMRDIVRDLQPEALQITKDLMSDFKKFFEALHSLKNHRKHIEDMLKSKRLDKEDREGIFEVFPNKFYKEKLERFERIGKSMASRFLEILVSANWTLRNMTSDFDSLGGRKFHKELLEFFRKNFNEDVFNETSEKIVDTCIKALIDYLENESNRGTRGKEEVREIKIESSSDMSISPEYSAESSFIRMTSGKPSSSRSDRDHRKDDRSDQRRSHRASSNESRRSNRSKR